MSTALDVACPLCGAAPDESCRALRVAENARSNVTEYGSDRSHRHIKRPHRERVDAARAART